MNEQTLTSAEQVSFMEFLFKNKHNRIILKLAMAIILIQFAVFKYLYPYASFIHGDSFSYIRAAANNSEVNFYLIGYSRFLRLFSVFSGSDTALVAFQYLLIQCSALFMIFTISHFYNPSKSVRYILLFLVVINPLFLQLANLVSSDCLFAALSFIWFSLLLWVMHQPSNKIIIWHAIILFIAFTVRYNALIYPIIAGGAFALSKLTLRKKMTGIMLYLLLCSSFIGYTIYKYHRITGYWQYSPFSGWQLSNNAMYAYRYVESTNRKPVPNKYKALDNMIRNYFDSTRDTQKHPSEAVMASTFYMWSPSMPLVKYCNRVYNKDTTTSEFKKWASMGPFYKSFGLYIIKQYPRHFIQYFIWPNTHKYYTPPVEFLEVFNSNKDTIPLITQEWFGYRSSKITTRMNNLKVTVLNFYPILSGALNCILLFSLICFSMLNRYYHKPLFYKGVFLAATVWLMNAGFTIFASSAALRYQTFPIILSLTFVVLLIDWLWMIALNSHIKQELTIVTIKTKSIEN